MKKIISVVLSLCILIGLMPISSFAESATVATDNTITVNGLVYTVSTTATLTGYEGSPTDVVIPSTVSGYSVTAIAANAFYTCKTITSVVIPDSVVSIGDKAFQFASALQTATIGSGVTSIGNRAFGNNDKLSAIDVSANNNYYASQDGVLFNKNKTTLIQYPLGRTSVAYTIPDGVTKVAAYAFYYCSRINALTVPSSLKTVEVFAFYPKYNNRNIYYYGTEADKANINIAASNNNLTDNTWNYLVETCTHSYDNNCDASCNECGATRTVAAHVYDNACDASCNECGATRTVAAHVYDNACDASCNECGAIRTVTSHAYDDMYDATCNVCGAEREVPDTPVAPEEPEQPAVPEVPDPEVPTNAPHFSVESVSVPAGNTVTVAVNINNNPGIVSFRLMVNYDTNLLELVSATNGSFNGITFGPIGKTPFSFGWVDAASANNTTNGAVAYLTFRAKDDAPFVATDITVTYDADDLYNYDFENVYFEVENGEINILCPHKETTFYPATESTCIYQGNLAHTVCDVCGEVIEGTADKLPLADHVWDNVCDTDCNTEGCDHTRVVPHVYSTDYDTMCNVCEHIREVAPATITEGGLTYLIQPSPDGGYAILIACDKTVSGAVVIPATFKGCSVVAIENNTFAGCTQVTSIFIPASVANIGTKVFAGCFNLESIDVDANNRNYSSLDGVLFNKDKTVLIQYPIGNTRASYKIPDTVRTMNDDAFQNSSNLTEITISVNISKININVFTGCTGIVKFIVPANNKYYSSSSEGILFNKEGTEIIKIPATSTNLRGYVIPDIVTTIGEDAFADCVNIKDITIPLSVVAIGNGAFRNCPNLANVYYRGSEADRENIYIGSENEDLLSAIWYYNSCIGAAEHTYSNACDDTCNVCGDHRDAPHVYSNNCDATCNNCDVTRIPADHIYDDMFDPDCNECSEVRDVPERPVFSVNTDTVKAGDTFELEVSIKNNYGIVSLKVDVGFDANILELVSAKGKDFANVTFGPTTKNPFAINWVDATSANNYTDGVVAVLTFRVKEDAPVGLTDITLTYDPENVYNYDFVNIPFGVENNQVEIIEYIPGDVNDDGVINNKDVGLLQRHINGWDVTIIDAAADVNKDGQINNKDVGLLQRYINGWDVELK